MCLGFPKRPEQDIYLKFKIKIFVDILVSVSEMLCKLHLHGRAIHLRIFCALIIYCFIPSIHLLEAQQFINITSIFCHLFHNTTVLNADIYFSPRFLMLPPPLWGTWHLQPPPPCRWQIISLVPKCHAVPGSWRDARQEDMRQWLRCQGQQHQSILGFPGVSQWWHGVTIVKRCVTIVTYFL